MKAVESSPAKHSFPVIKKAIIKHFSLYNKTKEISLSFDKDVFCLAGANGLGKSTFISILNFALTGIVKDPQRAFKSVVSTSKYYSDSKKFSKNYFNGRISDSQRETASVFIEFSLDDMTYILERNFFKVDKLIQFRRIDRKDLDETNSEELHRRYCQTILEHTGLASFDQYVFLQLFIFTFDEHHNLIVWDDSLMETTLYLMFGFDFQDAKEANKLRKKINELGSNRRNFVYHRSRILKDIKNIGNELKKLKTKVNDDLISKYEQLENRREETENQLIRLDRTLKSTELNISDHTSKSADLERKYNKLMQTYLFPSDLPIQNDSEILKIVNDLRTSICAMQNTDLSVDTLLEYIKENYCKSNSMHDPELQDRLMKIDATLENYRNEIDDQLKSKERLIYEIKEAKNQLSQLRKKEQEFEKQSNITFDQIKTLKKEDHSGILDSYQNQIEKLNEKIEKVIQEREVATRFLETYENKLQKNFALAEYEFIPIFRNYIEEFLGLKVSVLFSKSKDASKLIIKINDLERIDSYQLSESQRYFIDIGIRMAFIDFACENCMLLIDTPEGSLDIAYESKAGKMFSSFSKNFHLTMTANINSSQLLLELAKNCKDKGMRLERMTNWSQLSSVQLEEEDKINSAYKKISSLLVRSK